MNREQRQQLARLTLAALETGRYHTAEGAEVSIGAWQHAAVQGSLLYRPADAEAVGQEPGLTDKAPAEVRVYQATTLEAAAELSQKFARVGVLNFASARNPGGGFLGGSQAQEESLARSSGLYPCQLQFPEMYQHNAHRNGLYSDYAIYSPGVPVLLDDAGRWLPEPYRIDIITSPAVNAGALRRNTSELLPELAPTMRRRIRQVLGMAARHGCEALVLGAWGCGVFGNDPAQVARLFAEALAQPGWRNSFSRLDFAIFDPNAPHQVLRAFEIELAGLTS
ncbi:TIGR02452 family protein [Hymenobacter cellulosivorans]|uniref:TIGR02452 family protein n=1 Tax=Hymenobacter cellulosivorans TaxID=2932249 RepID=A0ABY4FCS3_9BACT|nr:TIGR02452 family protein [Hymenobacter cellulosivorans]UOQ52271.1 TIGR02452 family protein [Hymenobacter cellulosivorans]